MKTVSNYSRSEWSLDTEIVIYEVTKKSSIRVINNRLGFILFYFSNFLLIFFGFYFYFYLYLGKEVWCDSHRLHNHIITIKCFGVNDII